MLRKYNLVNHYKHDVDQPNKKLIDFSSFVRPMFLKLCPFWYIINYYIVSYYLSRRTLDKHRLNNEQKLSNCQKSTY